MGNFLPKMTLVEDEDKRQDTTTMKQSLNKNMEELKNLAQEFLGINGRQFKALYSCITEEAKEVNNAREQDLAMALRSMQEKMDHNSQETTTKVSNMLQKVEKVEKELVATKSNISSEEMLQIDGVKDDIRKLKEGVHALNLQMKLQEMAEDEIRIVKNCLKNMESELNSKLQMETDNYNLDEMIVLQDRVRDVTDDMRDVQEELENHDHEMTVLRNELFVVKIAVKSVRDELKDITKEIKSVKDVATNLAGDVMRELKKVQEELRDVKEKARGANVRQNETVDHIQEDGLNDNRIKVTDKVSCMKYHDLREIGVEVADELGMGVGGRLRDVRHELKSIRHEMRAANDEQRELTEADLIKDVMSANLIRKSNDTGRSAQTDHAQNVEPTLDDLRDTSREAMTKPTNNKKRNRDSRYPTLKQNKRMRKQSNRGDERGIASVLSTSVYPSSTDSDSSTSSFSSESTSSSYGSSDSDSSDSDLVLY